MENSLEDLHNHLFAQLERLSDESVKGDALKEEICRARAVSEIARRIVENGNLALKAQKMQGDGLIKKHPPGSGVKIMARFIYTREMKAWMQDNCLLRLDRLVMAFHLHFGTTRSSE